MRSFLQRYGNEKDARDAILTRLNNVDGIYSSQLAIEIRVGTLSVPDADHDQLSAATDPKGLLRELANLRKRSADLNSQGVTHLFTDRNLDGSTIGIAYLGSLCDKQNAVGLTESRNVWLDSLVAAHELGHNFGADHDGDKKGSCPNTPSSGFLMAPVVSGTDDFSSCSLNRMRQGAQHASCISNLPPANVRISDSLGSLHGPLGTPFAWQLYVMNTGGLTARDVRVELALPAALTIVDASVVGGSCTSGGGAVQCEIGDLAGGGSRAIELQLRGDVAGTNTITAQVRADNDSNRRDNEGSGSVVIEAPADVSVTLQGPTTATANKTFTVGFQIANIAADNAGTVTVQIDIPAGTTVGSASLANGSCTTAATQIECTLAPLGPGVEASGSVSLMASAAGQRDPARRGFRRLLRFEQRQRYRRARRRRQQRILPCDCRAPVIRWRWRRLVRTPAAPAARPAAIRPPPARLKARSTVAILARMLAAPAGVRTHGGNLQGLLPDHGRGSRREPGRDQARLSAAGA